MSNSRIAAFTGLAASLLILAGCGKVVQIHASGPADKPEFSMRNHLLGAKLHCVSELIVTDTVDEKVMWTEQSRGESGCLKGDKVRYGEAEDGFIDATARPLQPGARYQVTATGPSTFGTLFVEVKDGRIVESTLPAR